MKPSRTSKAQNNSGLSPIVGGLSPIVAIVAIVAFALFILITACTQYAYTSFIRLNKESNNKVRVFLGSKEAEYFLLNKEDFQQRILPEMQKQNLCPRGYRYVPRSISASGQGLQLSYLVECFEKIRQE